LWIAVFAVTALFFLSTTLVRGQDVAEAARQEQARKAAEKTAPRHVYTDGDLKKEKILTPEDEAKVASRKRQQPELTTAKADEEQRQPSDGKTPTESLGEIARRLRKEKAAREAEQAAAKKSYTPFHYEVPQTTTAAPKASIAPRVHVAPEAKRPSFGDAIRSRAPQKLTQAGAAHGRISPFEPRPFVTPHSPLTVVPAPAAPAVVVAPRPTSPISRAASARRSKDNLTAITVQSGDSWWKLAAIYLGSGSHWTELRALNPDVRGPAEMLRLGVQVLVPARISSRVEVPHGGGRATQLRVKAGDTLWALAREHLGRGTAWACLASANPQIKDYRRMTIGAGLEMPSTGMSRSCRVASEPLQR